MRQMRSSSSRVMAGTVGVHDQMPGEDEVVRGDRHAVGPAGIGAQVPDALHLPAVLAGTQAQAAVVHRGDLGGQAGHQPVLVVIEGQGFEQGAEDLDGRHAVDAEYGMERIRLARGGDDQGIRAAVPGRRGGAILRREDQEPSCRAKPANQVRVAQPELHVFYSQICGAGAQEPCRHAVCFSIMNAWVNTFCARRNGFLSHPNSGKGVHQ